jgi:hypothetical protein
VFYSSTRAAIEAGVIEHYEPGYGPHDDEPIYVVNVPGETELATPLSAERDRAIYQAANLLAMVMHEAAEELSARVEAADR